MLDGKRGNGQTLYERERLRRMARKLGLQLIKCNPSPGRDEGERPADFYSMKERLRAFRTEDDALRPISKVG